MGLNPNAPAWTPGLCSSGERSGDSPDRNGRAAQCAGMHHKREEGVESDGVGWLNLPANQDKHRADKFSQRVRTAIKQKQKKGGRKKRRRGRAKRRRARKAAQVARTRQKGRLVRVATYNVRTLAVKGANGYGRDFSVLYEAARLDISVVGLQETRRAGRTEFAAAGFRVFCCGSEAGGHHGVGLAVKESICSNSTYTTEYVDERPMAMRFEISGQSGAVNFVSAYAPTEVSTDETKQAFWDRLDSLVQRIPAKECVYVLMDANARTGRRTEGESLQDEGILGTYGRDELNDNGKLLLSFATDNKLAIMNTFFSTRKGGVSHTYRYNGVTGSRTSDFECIDYVLTRQAHRRRVRKVVVHPQPALPAKADLDHNMVIATVDLCGRIAHNRAIRAKPKQRQFSRQELQVEMSRWHVVERFLHNLGEQTGQPNTTAPEAARGFTKAILEAAQAVLPTERRIPRMPEWCESPEMRAAVEEALAKRREARRLMKSNRTPATWKALRAACIGTAVDEGIYAHLERYVTRLEAMYEDRDFRGLYKHLKKSVGLGGRQSGGQQYIKDENGVLMRDKAEILQRWARFFGTLLNTKSPKLNPAIIEEVQQQPAAPTTRDSVPLGSAPTLEETRRAIRWMHNWKAPGPDSLVAELLKIDEPAEPIVLERFHAILVEV